jgi:hypothetical protein
MSAIQEITNPQFNSNSNHFMHGKNMIQCNKNSDVYKFIKSGKKYVIELPDTKTIINVQCTFAALRAADMKIISEFVDGKQNRDNENSTFSYYYENFDNIYYTSFAYREKCVLYISINDLC